MATPWKHPKTGIYYFRKRVPADLVKRVGRAIEKESLGTKDARAAKSLFAAVDADYIRKWQRLRATPLDALAQPVTLSNERVHSIAGERYRELIAQHGPNPGHWTRWMDRLARLQNALPLNMREGHVYDWRDARADPEAELVEDVDGIQDLETDETPRPTRRTVVPGLPRQVSRLWFGPWVDDHLDAKGLAVTEDSRTDVCLAVAVATYFAFKQLVKQAKGDYSPDPNATRFPPPAAILGDSNEPLHWETLYEAFLLDGTPKPSTQKRQRGVLRKLFEFLGHDDMRKVTREDMIRWRDHNIGLGKASVTVRDADLAHPKTLFKYATEQVVNPLAKDPTVGIRVRVQVKQENRKKEYSLEEATKVLSWALVPCGPRTSLERAAAIRWVPWICAYHGPRVNEITQLREIDIQMMMSQDGTSIWMLIITPDAGPVKNSKRRDVALHPHLIEQGFLDYVRSRKGKRLFYDPSRARGGSSNSQSAKVGDFLSNWVRKTVGIDDPDVGPNHAWRHLFRSRCQNEEINEQIINAMEGHGQTSEGAKYGSVWPELSLRSVSKAPRFVVQPARKGVQVPGAPNGEGSAGPRSRKGEPNRGKRPPGRPLRTAAKA